MFCQKQSVTFLDPETDAQIFEYPAEEDYPSPNGTSDFMKPSSGSFSEFHIDIAMLLLSKTIDPSIDQLLDGCRSLSEWDYSYYFCSIHSKM